MKWLKHSFKVKYCIVAFAAIASLLTLHARVEARTFPGVLSVVVQQAFQFTEQSVVDFGFIPNVDGTCSMSTLAALSGSCAGSPNGQVGTMRIKGTPMQWLDMTLTQGAAVDGVTFVPVFSVSGTGLDSVQLDNFGYADVDIIGDLVLSSATSGAKALNYTLTVNYQ